MTMDSAVSLLSVAILISIQGLLGQEFEFSNPIKYTPSCGIENLNGQWSVNGNVKITANGMMGHDPVVIMQTNHELCTIDLSSCSNTTPTAQDACYCKKGLDSMYSLYVRRRARTSESGLMLQADMPNRDFFNPENVTVNIGKLPYIYDAVAATYQLDDSSVKTLGLIQNVEVTENKYFSLRICVSNLLAGSMLKLSEGGQDTTTSDNCLQLYRKYDFTTKSTHTLTVSYMESGACERSNTFKMQFTELKDANLTVKDKECMKPWMKPYFPSGLQRDICAATSDHCGLQLVTLTNGIEIMCDTETDGGGYIVVQKRTSVDVDFDRTWDEYQHGFGDLRGNFWYGLERIHRLCGKVPCELRFDMEFNNTKYFAVFSNFSLTDARDEYRIRISGYSGNAGDSILVGSGHNINNMRFTTKDNDNDKQSINCAVDYPGGWWFNKCMGANLNGIWGSKVTWKGVTWLTITGTSDSLSSSTMMVRPHDSS